MGDVTVVVGETGEKAWNVLGFGLLEQNGKERCTK